MDAGEGSGSTLASSQVSNVSSRHNSLTPGNDSRCPSDIGVDRSRNLFPLQCDEIKTSAWR